MKFLFLITLFFMVGTMSACHTKPTKPPCTKPTPKPPCTKPTPKPPCQHDPYAQIVEYCVNRPKCSRCCCFMAWYKQCHLATVKNDLCACIGKRCPWRW